MKRVGCQLCGRDDAYRLFFIKDFTLPGNGHGFDVVKCRYCSLVYINPQPDEKEMSRYYEQSYYGEDNVRFNRFLESAVHLFRKQRAREIVNMMPPGRILDVGCGRGSMLSYLRDRKWQVTGTENSLEASRHAREIEKLNVFAEDVCDAGFKNDYFDIITFYSSLEHLLDPKKVLAECSRILKKDGKLIIALPNIASIQGMIFRDKWFHLDVPRHCYHFSYKSLEDMLAQTGFKVYKVQHFSSEFSIYGVLQSLLNKIGLSHNLLYESIKSKGATAIKKKDRRYYLQLFVTIMILPFLMFISLSICLFESILRKGGVIKIYAFRKGSC